LGFFFIVAFTAESYSPALKEKVLQNDMQDLLSKPFKVEDLFDKLLTLLV
jgi:hypothetical protein